MPIDNRRYYDEFSSSYERHRHHGYHAFIDDMETALVSRHFAPLLNKHPTRPLELLEAGCGTGLVLDRLRAKDPRVAAYGVDLSGGMLQKAKARGLTVVQGSITALPFADASFDVVCSFKVLAHIEAIGQALSEMSRVLRPGGIVCAEFYNARSLRYLIKRLKPPTATSTEFHDEAVYTRYDTLSTIRSYLPPDLHITAVHGIRVATPLPVFHRLPLIAPALQSIERLAADLPVTKKLGGFLLVVAQKSGA
jgi:ubiquinone/menaquinone biosynthesis C-methylase UbiE